MTQHVTADEALIIARGERLGVDWVPGQFLGEDGSLTAIYMCSRCGRVICHPDCSRWKENACIPT